MALYGTTGIGIGTGTGVCVSVDAVFCSIRNEGTKRVFLPLLLHLCITYVYRVKPEQNHTTDRRRVHTGVRLCDIITRNSSNKMIQSFIATLYYVKPDSHEHGSRRNDAYDHFRFL